MGCSHPRVLRESRAYLVLLRVGFTRLRRSLGVPVGSYPAFSTLPTKALALKFGVMSSAFGVLLRTHHPKLVTLRKAEQAVCFLWHFPYPVRQRCRHFTGQSALRTTLPYGARTFLFPGSPSPGQSQEAALSSPSFPPFPLDLTIACSIA
jgi:hypothetical protein